MSLKIDPPRNGSLKNGSSNNGRLWNWLGFGLPADAAAPDRPLGPVSPILGALPVCEFDCRGVWTFAIGLGLAEGFCASTGSLVDSTFSARCHARFFKLGISASVAQS